MMQLLHRIKQVCDERGARLDSLFGGLDPRGGVSDREGDVAAAALGDDGHHAGDFGGCGDDAD
jgi:hypothetical protein